MSSVHGATYTGAIALLAAACGVSALSMGLGCRVIAAGTSGGSSAGEAGDAADRQVIGDPPTARASASPTGFVFPGDEVTLTGSGTDPDQGPDDRDVLGRWFQISGGPVDLGDTDSATVTFIVPLDARPGDTLGFEYDVTDADQNIAFDQVFLFIPRDDAVVSAVASALPDPAEAGAEVTLSSAGSFTAPEETALYAWEQVEGPDVGLDDATSPTARFVAPQPEGDHVTLTFRLTITNQGVTRSAHVEVTITPRDPAPAPEDEGSDGDEEVEADPAAGQAVYSAAGCGACHGSDASGGLAAGLTGPDLLAALDTLFGGGGNHNGTTLTDQEVQEVAAWLAGLDG